MTAHQGLYEGCVVSGNSFDCAGLSAAAKAALRTKLGLSAGIDVVSLGPTTTEAWLPVIFFAVFLGGVLCYHEYRHAFAHVFHQGERQQSYSAAVGAEGRGGGPPGAVTPSRRARRQASAKQTTPVVPTATEAGRDSEGGTWHDDAGSPFRVRPKDA